MGGHSMGRHSGHLKWLEKEKVMPGPGSFGLVVLQLPYAIPAIFINLGGCDLLPSVLLKGSTVQASHQPAPHQQSKPFCFPRAQFTSLHSSFPCFDCHTSFYM